MLPNKSLQLTPPPTGGAAELVRWAGGHLNKLFLLVFLSLAMQVCAESQRSIVTASALRLRSSPGIAAPTIGSLAKGGIVAVISKSSFTETIEGKTGPWAEVVDSSGIVGWAFSGFLATAEDDAFPINSEKDLINRYPVNIFRKASLLEVKLKNGQTKKFEDHDDPKYSCIGFSPEAHIYLIEAHYEAGPDFIVVDERTGDSIATFSESPIISPNKEKIIFFRAGNGGACSGLQIVNLTDKGIRSSEINFEVSEPYQSFWLDDRTVFIDIVSWAKAAPVKRIIRIYKESSNGWRPVNVLERQP